MKGKEIAEIAERMKRFENGIVCKSKDVTIEADWNPVGDGGAVYLIEYYKGETESCMFIHYAGFWWLDLECYDSFDEFKKETPKTFQNILLKLVEILNGKDTKEKMKKEEVQENVDYIRLLIEGVEASLFPIRWYLDDIWRNITPSDSEPLMCCLEEIEDLKKLCNELKIDVPRTPEVFLRDDIYVIKYEGKELLLCGNIRDVQTFLQGWILSCVDNVFKEAEKQIKTFLS